MDEPSKLVAVESIASGAILGTYEDTRFKSEVNKCALLTWHLSVVPLSGLDRYT